MRSTKNRLFALAALFATGSAGAFGAACSSTSHDGFDPDATDAGSDATTADAPSTTMMDAPISMQGDASPGTDANTPGDDSSMPINGGCSPVNGAACDIVAQNCPAKSGQAQQCVAVNLADGGTSTACQGVTAGQHLPKGHTCCPSAASNPCLPGLICIGDPNDTCSADAGLSGRCSPACCDDNVCGKSDPEGFAGRCELNIVANDGVTELYKVCEYNQQCKPFGVQPCPTGFTCLLEDQFGTSSCTTIFNPDGGTGSTEGAPCESANGCADGLMCLGPPDGGSTCQFLCLTPGTNPPFDAGAVRDGSAGHGGCPTGETCKLGFDPSQAPAWISICGP